MKRTLIIFIILAFLIPFVVQAGNSDNGNKNMAEKLSGEKKEFQSLQNVNKSSDIDENNKSGNGNSQKISNQEKTVLASQSNTTKNELKSQNEIKAMISSKKQEMAAEFSDNLTADSSKFKNQNTVRIAVQALLMAENIQGGIGINISQIARDFNSSVQSQYKNEEKIQTGNSLAKLFLGGNKEAAEEILKNTEENRLRIEELNRLISECECDEELKLMFTEQVQALENEQNRLNQTAFEEKGNKGIFGYLFSN